MEAIINPFWGMINKAREKSFFLICHLKGTVMQIKKAMANDGLRVSKVAWKIRIPTIYNFAVI